jgi:hypothetical protein
VTDVRAYAPGRTGTLADVVEQGPDLGQVTPAGPDSFAKDPSWSELFRAARPGALQSTPLYDDAKIGEGYAPILEQLGLPASENPVYFGALDAAGEARVGDVGAPSDLATAAKRGVQVPFTGRYRADRAIQEGLVLEQIRARRAKDPGFLSGVPDTVDGLHDYFEKQQAAKRAAGAQVLQRGSAFGRFTANLAAGGLESATHDPTFLPSMLIGGGSASTLLQAVGRDALINGVLTAAQQPHLAHNMAESGEHLTAGEVVTNVVAGTVLGGVLGGTIHLGATHVPPALFKVMPESVQKRWAGRMRVGENGPLLRDVLGDMDNRELATFARSTIGDHMTPDEHAAVNVIEREHELGEASPFLAGPAGDGAHQASVAETLKGIIDGTPREAPSRGGFLASSALTPVPTIAPRPLAIGATRVPSDIVAFLRGKGLDEGQAYGIAAGIAAEARGGDHTAVNSSSGAMGLGQWLGPRKAELLRRYGPNPSREQQLDFLWHELTGGDAGGKFVLAEKDPGRVLDAYIRKFMRPKEGRETTGDLERGMAALGRGGELPEGSTAGELGTSDDDLVAALGREADQAEAEAIAAAEARAGGDVEIRASSAEFDPTDVPILKRELFDSDADWAEAQVAFRESVEAENSPQSAGNGPPAGAESGRAAELAPDGPASERPPGLVYHGTDYDFDQFDTADFGSWFAEHRDTAESYLGRTGEGKPRMIAARIRAERPLVIPEAIDLSETTTVGESLRAINEANGTNFTPEDLGRSSDGRLTWSADYEGNAAEWIGLDDRFPALARKSGFDSILAYEQGERTWNVFTPDQIEILDHGRASIAETVDQVRIDDPELAAFDQGGRGREQQLESLEHDARMAAAEPAHPVTGETLSEAKQRSDDLRDSFPAAEPDGAPGTHNLGNSAPVPGGGTRGELRADIFHLLMSKPADVGHEAHLVLGPPAAGKSSFAEPLAEATGSRLIDADEAKAMLPEFENGIGAAAVHEESSRIAAVAADATIRNGENVVLPLVGRTYDGVRARIEDLVKAGYKVYVHIVDLPGDKAAERAIARFEHTGRLVDPGYVRSVGNKPLDTFGRIIGEYGDQLGGYVHVSNDVPRGEKPRLVAASSDELAARYGFSRGAQPGEGARAPQGGSAGLERGSPETGVSGLERRYQLADDGEPQTLAEILAELDADRVAVDALKACTLPRAA